ncbi:MAG: TAXI family TRAP transporter solute-binding subunit, partial [Desulfomonile tiedjei]|nr:TAXI family TRAP transporter solute-binding subunit [Desulfomonile tiedjei]
MIHKVVSVLFALDFVGYRTAALQGLKQHPVKGKAAAQFEFMVSRGGNRATGDLMMRRGTLLTLVLLVSSAVPAGLEVPSVIAAQETPWKSGESIDLVLATGGTGGTYFPLGGGIAKLWKDAIPGLNVTVQATGASVANIRLLGKREADLALVQNDTADYGRTGRESFIDKKEKYTNYLAIAALYPEAVQIVVRSGSSIRNIEELKGKKVVVGAAASGTELASRQIFSAYGINYKERKDITPLFLGFA